MCTYVYTCMTYAVVSYVCVYVHTGTCINILLYVYMCVRITLCVSCMSACIAICVLYSRNFWQEESLANLVNDQTTGCKICQILPSNTNLFKLNVKLLPQKSQCSKFAKVSSCQTLLLCSMYLCDGI